MRRECGTYSKDAGIGRTTEPLHPESIDISGTGFGDPLGRPRRVTFVSPGRQERDDTRAALPGTRVVRPMPLQVQSVRRAGRRRQESVRGKRPHFPDLFSCFVEDAPKTAGRWPEFLRRLIRTFRGSVFAVRTNDP
jgi:hypothetical protein